MKIKCLYPFTFLEFHPKGDVFCCCPAWTKAGPVGNLYKQTIEEIWNGPRIKKIRKNIYENNYQQVCKMDYCPYINNPINLSQVEKKASSKLKKIIQQIKQRKTHLDTLPLRVSLAQNAKCNLRCKMCISHQGYCPVEPKLNELVYKRTLPKLFSDLETIKLTGNGDPFAQKSTLDFMQNFDSSKYPDINFKILTNAQLLNKKLWQKIKHLDITSINISIDAATKKTYEKIRVGGNWETLQKNLKFISQLRKNNKINNLVINMTVMKSNYKELVKFAKMGLKFNCDYIHYRKIFGAQTLTENINTFTNKKAIDSIKKSLQDPVFDNPKINTKALKEYKEKNISLGDQLIAKAKLIIYYPIGKVVKSTRLRKLLKPFLNFKRFLERLF